MIRFTPEAASQIAGLADYYERLERTEALRNLRLALLAAEDFITQRPQSGLPAPRPYSALFVAGQLWVKRGSYWIVYAPEPPVTILGIFHEAADIPRRV
ncbi:type II toxin-antitoxin system RelE/ParE family toxin [Acidisoma cladoniae]|uniref:type II toxin-antitoxin system RelE/ParE family toxin n=1 Tax=Acidisoma cladoniae TaxID=3040935 RepID=UPI00254B9DDC|nr:type II toxin-antitoxin system RelE/ParE family toxin [Acidisoma sp. PAMC 29798]